MQAGNAQSAKPVKRSRRRALNLCGGAMLALLLLLLLVLAALDQLFPLNLPEGDADFARVVTDARGQPLRVFADGNGVWRYPVTHQQVSDRYLQALLTYEDRWFWQHPGVNPLALARAALQNFRHGERVSGGSTLTMQVARILHPHSRSLGGKLQQMLRALQLEWHLDKGEILDLYLNRAPFGGTIEGVEAAAYTYLGKSADYLSHGEAALLAVLPQAPSRLRPDRHPQRARQARDKVLSRMVSLGVWSAEQSEAARQEAVVAFHRQPPMRAPLLSRRLLNESDQPLIKTTIDGELQLAAEDYVAHYVRRLPPRTAAAVLIVDNDSMAVKVYVGTAQFGNAERYGYVDMVRAIRSPGSTLKPLLYGLALDDGLIHSHSLLADVPRSFGNYRPANFSEGFSGPVSAAEALQRSLNLPAVDLLQRYGPRRFVSQLSGAGLDLQLSGAEAPGLAVILGGVGSNLEQLVQGFRAIGAGGMTAPLRFRRDDPLAERRLLSPGSAWVLHRLLRDTPRPTALRTHRAVASARPIAWKTGTSYGHRDTWALGSDGRHTVGVWVGRPDGSPMPGHYGAHTAGPLLFALFDQLPEAEPPAMPRSVQPRVICWPWGIAAEAQPEPFCQQRHQAWIVAGQVPATFLGASDETMATNPLTFWVDRASGQRVMRGCAPAEMVAREVALWPAALEPWVPRAYRRAGLIPPPHPDCGAATLSGVGRIRVADIEDGITLKAAPGAGALPSLPLIAEGGVGQRYWYINGRPRYSARPGQAIVHQFANTGRFQLMVMDSQGSLDRVSLQVLP